MRAFLLITTLLATSLLCSQEKPDVFVPYYVENDTIRAFERVGAKEENKVIGFGYGGVNSYLTVFDKKHSSVRFKKDQLPTFYIELKADTDPWELVVISKADVPKKNKNYRRFVAGGSSMGGGTKKFENIFMTELEKVKDNLYKIVIERDLPEGEYTFMPINEGNQGLRSTAGSIRIYCFGVD